MFCFGSQKNCLVTQFHSQGPTSPTLKRSTSKDDRIVAAQL